MEKEAIFTKVQDIFRIVLKNDSLELDYSMNAEDIQGWDSLANAELILKIENDFNIKFSLMEMLDLDSVEGIVSSIQNKVQ